MNSPLPFQSAGAHFLEVTGPLDKNALIAGMVGGTPDVLRGTDPLGYVEATTRSWFTGNPLDTAEPGTPEATAPAASSALQRIGIGLLAIVLIGIGVWWAVKA